MDWPSEPVLLEGLSAAEYHADRLGDVPSLSRSIAHTLITASPKHAAAEHPRLIGTAVRKSSKAMDLGSLVHCLLLGGEEQIVIVHHGDFRTNAAKAVRDDAYARGLTPILEPDLEEGLAAVEILKPEICRAVDEVRVREGGVSTNVWMPTRWEDFGRELTCLWEEGEQELCSCGHREDRHGRDIHGVAYCFEGCSCQGFDGSAPVRCRARFDLYLPSAALIGDVKVVTGGAYAKAGPFCRQLNSEEDSGAMQAASYCRGLEAVHPELAGRTTFVFLRVEPVPPYSVVPIVVAQGLCRLGEDRWMRGVQGWASCMASGVWPGPGVAYAQAEPWAVQRELDRMAEQEGADVDAE